MAFAWLRPARPAGAVLLAAVALFLALQISPAAADQNELRIEPSSVEVAPGGTTTVSLVTEPPATTLTIWAIDVLFDPSVVATDTFGCDLLDSLPNSQTIGVCPVVSSTGNDDDPNDVVKVLGAMIFNKTEDGHQAGDGLSLETVLADITFDVVGEPGECTDLRLFVRYFSDVDAQETNPQLFDGQICVEGDAPASGTSVPKTVAPRTADPTAPGGDVTLPPATNDVTGAPGTGDETPGEPSEGASPGDTVSRTGNASSETSQASGDGSVIGIDEDNGGGVSVVFWVLLGFGALLVVSGAAWAVVRSRGSASGND